MYPSDLLWAGAAGKCDGLWTTTYSIDPYRPGAAESATFNSGLVNFDKNGSDFGYTVTARTAITWVVGSSDMLPQTYLMEITSFFEITSLWSANYISMEITLTAEPPELVIFDVAQIASTDETQQEFALPLSYYDIVYRFV